MTSDDKDKKGFGGFADLLSDVSEEIKTATQKPASEQAHEVTQTTHSTSQQTSTPPRQPSPPPLPLDKSGGGSEWVLAIFVVIVIVIAASLSLGKKEEATAPIEAPAYESSYEAPISSVDSAPAVEEPVAEPAPVAITNPEELPPVGSDLVLTENQIRYCIAEDVRLSEIKKVIDSNSQHEVNRFNGAIEDLNSRCSSFKYRSGTLESVQDEINSRHAALILEGLERLDSWRSQESSQSGITEPATDAQSVAVQLGAEPPSPSVSTQPNLAELSTYERSFIESKCSYAKAVQGPTAYKGCLNNELAKLANAPPQPEPNLSGLSTYERSFIESKCSYAKAVQGPTAYKGCLNNELAKLANAPPQPDLSEQSTGERTSIESPCLSDLFTKSQEAYDNCLARQLSRLR